MQCLKIFNQMGFNFRRNTVQKLNNIYYHGQIKKKLSGREVKKLVEGRKIAYEWVDDNPGQMALIIYDKMWTVDDEKWNQVAEWLTDLYVDEQLEDKVVKAWQANTFFVVFDVYPYYD